MKIGGNARYFLVPATQEELIRSILRLTKEGIPYVVLGRGSNILICDDVIPAAVIKLGEGFRCINPVSSYVCAVGAATALATVLRYCIENRLGGLEMFAGIPATIGGLACMNASCFKRDFLSLVEEVRVIDRKGKEHSLSRNVIRYGYRKSNLDRFIITEVVLKFKPEENVKKNIAAFLAQRIATQDFRFPSLGCIFKNPPGYSAGALIDECGLKGLRIGDAAVSDIHANFIVNHGHARAGEVDQLIKTIKDKVWDKFKIMLSEEIRRWGC